jgi:hypothetical protein
MRDAGILLSQFVETVNRTFDRERLTTFWQLEEPLAELVRAGAAARVMNEQLARLVVDPAFDGEWQTDELVLHRGRGFILSASLHQQRSQYIHTMPYNGICVPMGQRSLRHHVFRIPANYDNNVFDPSVRLELVGSGETAPGKPLRLNTEHQVYDFQFDGPVTMLQLTTAPFHMTEWLFSRDTLLAWQANDSSVRYSQLRVAAYVLGRLAHQSSLEPLSFLTTHPHHSVRWAAVQGLGRINRTVAVEKLQEAVSDSHPHVRRAAARTLQQLRRS